MPTLPAKMKILLILAKKFQKNLILHFSRSVLFHAKTRVILKYFVTDCNFTDFALKRLRISIHQKSATFESWYNSPLVWYKFDIFNDSI